MTDEIGGPAEEPTREQIAEIVIEQDVTACGPLGTMPDAEQRHYLAVADKILAQFLYRAPALPSPSGPTREHLESLTRYQCASDDFGHKMIDEPETGRYLLRSDVLALYPAPSPSTGDPR